MANSVIFFTAGAQPTAEEQVELDKVVAATQAPITLKVMNLGETDYTGYTDDGLIMPDYVYALAPATVPEAYAGVSTLDPDNLPGPDLLATQAIVANGETLEITDAASGEADATVTVAASEVTSIKLAGTSAIISHGGTLAVVDEDSGTATAALAITAGVPTVTVPGDKAIVTHEGTIAGTGGTFTLTVVDGVVGGTWTPEG